MANNTALITINDLTMAYGDYVIQHDLNFEIKLNDIFIIMGGSGCGKSSLMRHMVGLKRPKTGQVIYGNTSYWDSTQVEQQQIKHSFGVMYQSGALWSSMTLAENISLLLEQYTDLTAQACARVASLKLALVGLRGFEDFYPSEISGGMQKRAGIARAMAMDPEILFFDEPSAGLDPVSAKNLDKLILELSDNLGTTMVIITHELASIFAIGNNSVFLDPETKTMITSGNPNTLLKECDNPKVQAFLTRGEL